MTTLHPESAAVTDRVIERSRIARARYLDLVACARDTYIERPAMGCANAAYYRYPERMKVWAREAGATAQVAGGVLTASVDAAEWAARTPAICPGETEGMGRVLFGLFRPHADEAERGASPLLAGMGC